VTDSNWYTGNAADENLDYRGWLLGHFIDPADGAIRKTEALEIKWGIHPIGQKRAEWTVGEQRSTLVILVSGRFRMNLSVTSVTLERPGDYLIWGPGIDHSWQAEEDTTVITVRWPSIPLDPTVARGQPGHEAPAYARAASPRSSGGSQ
jgi:hypothetical protein